jgi:hypothetical protein
MRVSVTWICEELALLGTLDASENAALQAVVVDYPDH